MKIKSNILFICVFSLLVCHVSATEKGAKTLNKFEPTSLFTDASCSRLKDKVTLKKIKACAFSFYKELALSMYNKQYNSNYRIASYKAYEHPDVQAKQLKTGTYSLLDNPTGISVAEGDTLLVLVANVHNQKISLRIHNWDVPGKDGFSVKSDYPLKSGENQIVTKNSGLVYIMYHTPDFRTVAPIKIHFAKGGKINGYFDVTKNSREQWKTMIKAATDKHYDVLGHYAHLIFPVENLAKCNGQDLIDFYDRLVYEEQRFMGLEKYGKMRNNRMLFNVMYKSFMYSAPYHTAYNVKTMTDLCNVRSLLISSWGPAHEVGHSNQTRPGLKWIGTTETTNNIQSMYIQRLFGSASRLQMLNKYERAMNTVFRTCIHHHFIKDHFEKLIPFWQLELYMEYILGNTDIQIEIIPVPFDKISDQRRGESSETIRERVIKARQIQEKRYAEYPGIYCNAQMNSKLLSLFARPDDKGLTLLKNAMDRLNLSARAYDRILKVSCTIADLEGSEQILSGHLAEAISYRNLDRENWAG